MVDQYERFSQVGLKVEAAKTVGMLRLTRVRDGQAQLVYGCLH